MPRELPKPPAKPPVVIIPTKDNPQDKQADYTDLKLKTIAENVAKLYVPFGLGAKEDISETAVDSLSNEAYLYVDDNGKPSKVLAVTVLRKEIHWDDLSEDVQRRLQELAESAALTPGAHITIENGVISADIGVETVNGKSGNVVLTAADVGALSSSTAIPHKLSELTNDTGFVSNSVIVQEIDEALETLEVDGGRI